MHPHTLLELGSALLSRVLRFEHPADATVADFFRQQGALGSRERALLADAVFAVLRDRPRLQWLAASHPGRTPQQERPARPQRPNHAAQPQGTAQTRALLLLAWTGPPERLQAACTPEEWDWRTQALARQLDASAPPACRHGLPDWLAEALRAELRLQRAGAVLGQPESEAAVEPEAEAEAEAAEAAAALHSTQAPGSEGSSGYPSPLVTARTMAHASARGAPSGSGGGEQSGPRLFPSFSSPNLMLEERQLLAGQQAAMRSSRAATALDLSAAGEHLGGGRGGGGGLAAAAAAARRCRSVL